MSKNNILKFEKDKLKFAIFSIIAFLGIEVIARMYDWYRLFPNYDILSHLLFGIGFFSLLWIFLHNKIKNSKSLMKLITIQYFIIGLGWELLEKIGDKIFSSPQYLKDIFFFDGVSDIIFGFIGLYIANIFLKK